MTKLKSVQSKVSLVSIFLFGKETKIPKTIKGCENKLSNYYRFYGETYISVCKKQNIKLTFVGKV